MANAVEPVAANKSGWDWELEETTSPKAMVGIELLYIRTPLQTSRTIRKNIIRSRVIISSCGLEQSMTVWVPEISRKVNA